MRWDKDKNKDKDERKGEGEIRKKIKIKIIERVRWDIDGWKRGWDKIR